LGSTRFCEVLVAVHDSGSDNPEVLVFSFSVEMSFLPHIFGDVHFDHKDCLFQGLPLFFVQISFYLVKMKAGSGGDCAGAAGAAR